MRWFLLVAWTATLTGVAHAGDSVVAEGQQVAIEFSLKLENETIETNVGKPPLVFEAGAGNFPPAFEAQIVGMKVNESKTFTLPPEQAFGHVQPDLFMEVAREQIPEDSRRVDAIVVGQDAAGNHRRVRVHEVRDDSIVVDLNHPLAGKTIGFDVRVVEVIAAEK